MMLSVGFECIILFNDRLWYYGKVLFYVGFDIINNLICINLFFFIKECFY